MATFRMKGWIASRVHPEEIRAINRIARERKVSKAVIVREALRQYVERKEQGITA